MMRDSNGDILPCLDISVQQRREMIDHIKSGIIRNLSAIRKMIEIDVYISAGVYTYALEEFGKLIVLRDTEFINGKYRVNYANRFVKHPWKFNLAFDFLKKNNYGDCLVLAEGGFDSEGFESEGFETPLLAEFESRLSIFYAGFRRDGSILEVPAVEPEALRKAINKLELATNKLAHG